MMTEALAGLVLWRRRIGLSRPKHSAPVLLSGKDGIACCDLEIGDSGTFVQAPPAVFQFFADVELLIEVVQGELKVTSWLTDRAGQRLAQLLRNEWSASVPPPGWYCDYTSDAVEVRDGSRIVFQAKLVSDRIQIQGEWWRNGINGMRLVKADDPLHPGAFIMFFGPASRPEPPEIQAIFDHPN